MALSYEGRRSSIPHPGTVILTGFPFEGTAQAPTYLLVGCGERGRVVVLLVIFQVATEHCSGMDRGSQVHLSICTKPRSVHLLVG
jgi:hypothetical protein